MQEKKILIAPVLPMPLLSVVKKFIPDKVITFSTLVRIPYESVEFLEDTIKYKLKRVFGVARPTPIIEYEHHHLQNPILDPDAGRPNGLSTKAYWDMFNILTEEAKSGTLYCPLLPQEDVTMMEVPAIMGALAAHCMRLNILFHKPAKVMQVTFGSSAKKFFKASAAIDVKTDRRSGISVTEQPTASWRILYLPKLPDVDITVE